MKRHCQSSAARSGSNHGNARPRRSSVRRPWCAVSCLLTVVAGCGVEKPTGGSSVASTATLGSHTIEVRVVNLKGAQACFNEGELLVELLDADHQCIDSHGRLSRDVIGHPQSGGDLFAFQTAEAGSYHIRVTAAIEKTIWADEEPLCLPCLKQMTLEEFVDQAGYRIGSTDRDTVGQYEIVDRHVSHRLPVGSEQAKLIVTGVALEKKYDLQIVSGVRTHVDAMEDVDHVLAVVDTPVEDEVLRALGQYVAKKGVEIAARNVQSKLLKEALGNDVVPTVLVRAVTDFENLVSVDTGIDIGTDVAVIVLFGTGSVGAAVGLAAAVLPPLIVSEIGKGIIQENGCSDDFRATCRGYLDKAANMGEGTVEVHNLGEPLGDLIVKMELQGASSRWIDVSEKEKLLYADSEKTLAWKVTPEMVSAYGPGARITGQIVLAYKIQVVPSTLFSYARRLFVSSGESGNPDAELQVVGVGLSCGVGIGNRPMPKIIAAVRNNGKEPANIYLRAIDGRMIEGEQLEWERSQDADFQMPFGLGCEVQYDNSGPWRRPITMYTWIPLNRPADMPTYEAVDEVTIPPGERALLSAFIAEGPTGARVFVVDPDLQRIDERCLSAQLSQVPVD